jgi:hypothetical protein
LFLNALQGINCQTMASFDFQGILFLAHKDITRGIRETLSAPRPDPFSIVAKAHELEENPQKLGVSRGFS